MNMQPVYINRIASIHSEKSTESQPYLSASEPDYKDIIANATLRRRMSRIVKMGVACGLECIGTIPPKEIHAIITATGLGCLADTDKFMNALIDSEERMLNPTPFIQSTFNTIGAQIALLCQVRAYNVTYVHRGLSFESALLDAMMRIREGNDNVLVGAVDEITANSYTIMKRLGLLKGISAGEGAQFFLLGQHANDCTLAEINGVETFIGMHSTEKIIDRITRFLQRNELNTQDIDWFITGKNGNPKQDAIYATLETELFPKAKQYKFKDECGEFQTASSYAVWKAVHAFETTSTLSPKTVLIYNHYQSINHSLILIRKRV